MEVNGLSPIPHNYSYHSLLIWVITPDTGVKGKA